MLTSAAGAAAGTRRPAPLGPRVRGRAGALVGAAPRSGGAAPTVRRPWPRRRGRAGSTSAAPSAAAGTPTRRSWRPSCPLAPHRTGTTQQVSGRIGFLSPTGLINEYAQAAYPNRLYEPQTL